MDERWIKLCCVAATMALLPGCAQTQYRATELPGQYAARPIRNYATVDFTPHAKAIADQNTIAPGDQLVVSLNTGTHTEDATLEWKASVDESGNTSLPNIGTVRVAGLSRPDAEKQIVRASLDRDVFLTPTVELSVQQKAERTIIITGAVRKPGPITVRGEQVTLADVLVRAGGLTSNASGEVSVTGSDQKNAPGIVLPNAIQSVGSTADHGFKAITVSVESTPPEQFAEIAIPDGSVVHVEERAPRPIIVTGVIKNQSVEVPAGQNVRLLDALTFASGQTYSNWISDRITVIRRVPGRNETIRIGASIRRARNNDDENLLLAPNDIVNVEENILTFTLSTLGGLFGAGVSASQIGAF